MPRFVVRVELPGKPPGDYGQLHRDLRAARYYRVIKGEKRWWHLPHAEYTCQANGWTVTQIRDEVLALARASHSDPHVFVSEASNSAWVNLRPVTAQDPAPDDT